MQCAVRATMSIPHAFGTDGRRFVRCVGNELDVGSGRWLPTTAVDQYAATLARWFGVADSDLDSFIPNLKNFSQRNLGFV